MIGSALARTISKNASFQVNGIGRRSVTEIGEIGNATYSSYVDLNISGSIPKLFDLFDPDVVINCAGITKHYLEGTQPVSSIQSNALLPHILAGECSARSVKLVQISTDCVFSGAEGSYTEFSVPDAVDFYGKSKALGEVIYDGHLTIRTSTIGHENSTCFGLLEWFLRQQKCLGFSKAIFSGLPSVVLGRVIRDYVLPNDGLSGLYNVGGRPIDKFQLLKMISERYGHHISIKPDQTVVINRSLNSGLFEADTGFFAPDWFALINEMYEDYLKVKCRV